MINKFYNPFKPHIVVDDEGKYYVRRLEFSWSSLLYEYKYCKQSEYQEIHYPSVFDFDYYIDYSNYAYDDLMDAQRTLNVIKSLNRSQPKPKKRKFKKI